MTALGTVRVDPQTLDRLHLLCGARLPDETGGILLGYRTAGEIVVVDTLEVPDSKAHRFGYIRRRAPAQRLLDTYLAAEPPSSDVGWVGDFHSHPADQSASRTDLRTLRRNARADGSPLALLVIAHAGGTRWTAYGYTSDGSRPQPAAVTSTL